MKTSRDVGIRRERFEHAWIFQSPCLVSVLSNFAKLVSGVILEFIGAARWELLEFIRVARLEL